MDLHVKLSPLEVKLTGGGSGQDSSAVLAAIQQLERKLQMQLDALTVEVERDITLTGSVITLLNGLATKIEALKADPVKLQKLVDDIRNNNDATAAAVLANTPAEEPTP